MVSGLTTVVAIAAGTKQAQAEDGDRSEGAGDDLATPSVSYTYDPAYNRLATMLDGTGTTAYTYPAAGETGAGQVASVNGPLTADTITYAYDDLGRVSS